MTGDDSHAEIALGRTEDIVRARQAGREMARTLGFGLADQTRLATAISEIARNALHYGGGGMCAIVGNRDQGGWRIVITVSDQGPGIPDIEKAMTPGYSTGNSLGMGLPGARRLMDSLDIATSTGGTSVVMSMRRKGAA